MVVTSRMEMTAPRPTKALLSSGVAVEQRCSPYGYAAINSVKGCGVCATAIGEMARRERDRAESRIKTSGALRGRSEPLRWEGAGRG
jgi:hypothetical protein